VGLRWANAAWASLTEATIWAQSVLASGRLITNTKTAIDVLKWITLENRLVSGWINAWTPEWYSQNDLWLDVWFEILAGALSSVKVLKWYWDILAVQKQLKTNENLKSMLTSFGIEPNQVTYWNKQLFKATEDLISTSAQIVSSIARKDPQAAESLMKPQHEAVLGDVKGGNYGDAAGHMFLGSAYDLIKNKGSFQILFFPLLSRHFLSSIFRRSTVGIFLYFRSFHCMELICYKYKQKTQWINNGF